MALYREFEKIPISLAATDTAAAAAVKSELIEKLDTTNIITLDGDILDFLATAFSLSPYLKSCAFKDIPFLLSLFKSGFKPVFDTMLSETKMLGMQEKDEEYFMARLRQLKRSTALLCGLADLGGWWSCRQVTQALSDFASASLGASLDFLLLQEHDAERLTLPYLDTPQKGSGFIVLGMGKLGAGELNYSSDIDLILFFDVSAPIHIKSDDAITYWNRLAKKLVRFMQERTAEGYVFRTDLRLRPDPSATPLVIPIEAALVYYEGQGQNWERAAMIKAKPVAGDIEAGHAFLAELSPFVWRKYLDFAAIDDIRSIKRQIHAHKGYSEISVLGHNIKLGRGGIREIEFFAQTQQLIAGGRSPELRVNETVKALSLLAEMGWIKKETSEELEHAYWFLRNLENRIQMVADQQIHTLPERMEELAEIATMFGEKHVVQFSTRVEQILKTVESHYAALFEHADELGSGTGNLVFTGDTDDPETVRTLEIMGYENPTAIIKTVRTWHMARLPALRNAKARELLTELMPFLIHTFSIVEAPDASFAKFDRFLSGLPAGIQFFSILKSNPNITALLVRILDAAPRLADMIARRPHVFDAFLDPQFDAALLNKDGLYDLLQPILAKAVDYEMALDDARRFFQQCQFLIGAHLFTGKLTPSIAQTCFTVLAEVMVQTMLEVTQKEFAKRHGSVEGAQICVLAMGRLGSMELSATSDLDLIFLYSDHDEAASNGEKTLYSSQYFIRLMQRFITAMSSPTAEGIIFELDFRLRPSGNSGPIATHVDHFLKYQAHEAWVWEAQALTRARPVAGNDDLCKQIVDIRPRLIAKAIADKNIKREIREMRFRIEEERQPETVWDIKNVAGGLIDLEFIAQYLVLENGAQETMMTRDIFRTYPSALSASNIDELEKAYDLYTQTNTLIGICIGKNFDISDIPAGFLDLLCSHFDLPDIASLEAYLKQTQKHIREIFLSVFK